MSGLRETMKGIKCILSIGVFDGNFVTTCEMLSMKKRFFNPELRLWVARDKISAMYALIKYEYI